MALIFQCWLVAENLREADQEALSTIAERYDERWKLKTICRCDERGNFYDAQGTEVERPTDGEYPIAMYVESWI